MVKRWRKRVPVKRHGNSIYPGYFVDVLSENTYQFLFQACVQRLHIRDTLRNLFLEKSAYRSPPEETFARIA